MNASSAITLYARPSSEFEDRVASALNALRSAQAQHTGVIVQASSLGAEDMVITDLIAREKIGMAIGTLQTGALHAQTLALIPRIQAHYGLLLEVYTPQSQAVVEFVARNGEKAMYQSLVLRKACCAMRKLEPLARMLTNRTGWVTGLRKEQSANRGDVPPVETDEQGRTKYNPLFDWSWGDVWHYIAHYQVPYNPLHDQFMPSIGCEPCTRAIAVGEDFRAGRWWWEDEAAKECGLHVHAQTPPATAVSPLRTPT
jgi:phosphoadenosine phosphosulfate reductase